MGVPHEAGRSGGAGDAGHPRGHAPARPRDAAGARAARAGPARRRAGADAAGPASTSSNQSRGRRGYASSESTPLVVGGVLYMSTPYARVVALDPASGKEKWAFQLPSGNPSTRGLEYWPGDATTPAQIVFGTSDAKLYSIDAATGTPNRAFGDGGVVNLDTPEILRGLPGRNGLTSPPNVFKHLVITGGTTQENPPRGPAGDVRAWDMHTGKLAWTFRSVPQPGERFGETWAGDSARNRSGVNVWGFFSVDTARGIVYMPFGAPSVDQYGGDRAGDNLFGTSLVAANAETGAYLWHFQLTHHDIWDADLAAAPVLLDVTRAGKTIPAVAVVSKQGLLFLLDRTTGKPIDAVEERPVPASEVPLERAAKTQPFPLVTPPLSRMSMAAARRRDRHAGDRGGLPEADGGRAARRTVPAARLQSPARAVPRQPRRRQLGRHVVLARARLPVRQHQRARTDLRPDARGPEGATGPAAAKGQGNRVDPGGPYEGVAGGGRFSIRNANDPQQLPCQQPPWGQLTAVDMKTGRFAWRVPLGVTDSLPPDLQKTGRPGNGGTIVTRGGLVFVGATDDGAVPRLRRAHRQGAVDVHAAGGGAGDADHLSRRGRPAIRRHHVDRRRLLRQSGDRRQRHGVRAAATSARSRPAQRRGEARLNPRAGQPTREPGGFGVDGPACLRGRRPRAAALRPRRTLLAPPADDAAVAPDRRAGVAVRVEHVRACAGRGTSRVPSSPWWWDRAAAAARSTAPPAPASSRSSGIT